MTGSNNGALTNMNSTADWILQDGSPSCNTSASSRKKALLITTNGVEQEAVQFSVYPNLTKGNFTLDFGKITASSIVNIADYTGKLISRNSYSDSTTGNVRVKPSCRNLFH
ncbi:MAG: hypothetical protein JKY48_19030 [Flavobacteriales bacterium]|nr:hypothetical protein [Flavobacteriales bacterium]